jgi:D-alanyl-D-alanine carboxypeptidase
MHRRRLLTTLAAGLVAAPLAAAPAAAVPDTADPERERLLQDLLEAEHAAGMPGLFAQVRAGGDIWRGAAGAADVTTGRAPKPSFQHRIGSITKTFVATTVLQLVGEGRLSLDAPIGDHLPEVVPGELGSQVTIRMLLNHTSGIADYDHVLLGTADDIVNLGKRTVTRQELLAIALAQPPTGAPGALWSYSNTGYIILGLLIERITGRPYSAEASRRILRPLRLHDTYFPGTDPHLRGPHMNAYLPWTDGTLRDFTAYNMSWAWAAGELVSTAHDLNRFYRALLTGRLLRPDLLAQMQTTVPTRPETPEGVRYGLGLLSLPLPCGRFWGHDGVVIGQGTLSLHSEDGNRQLSLAENVSHYTPPDVPHPIDYARGRFLVAALCGSGDAPAVTTSVRGGGPLRLPSGVSLNW